jgi:hypothetical protein
MFTRFAERGLALPASDFFKGLLGYYGIEYLNLNPNGIFHTAVFVHFCEAFLGIKPHWILFRKFFRVKPQPSASNPLVVGGAGIHMREDAAEQYLSYKLIDSNQDWKAKWFYVTNHHPGLPKPSGKQPKHRPWWNSKPTMQEGIQLPELLARIKMLREAGLRAEHVAFSCRCLNHSTSMGGTRSKVEGGDRHDLEPEGTREDTRHEIYTGSGSRSSYPTSCLG